MKFSIYSEIQHWGGKNPARLYDEVLEQIVHADRLGYDCYSIIEHNFFPNFSISSTGKRPVTSAFTNPLLLPIVFSSPFC